MSKPFKFKQFNIKQDQCAMKVGTDGVLLGAWVQTEIESFNALDIGSGTGVISLMLAQRFPNTQIEALEIDESAFEQTVVNFENSPWGDRLFGYHASFQEYFQEVDDEKYDLIISNPPFFSPTQKTPDEQRNKARFQDALPFEHLLYGASKLLNDDGLLALIIPFDQEKEILSIAQKMHLKPFRITHVKGNTTSAIKRSLLELKFDIPESGTKTKELVIEIDRHVYTEEYKELVKDFYLKL